MIDTVNIKIKSGKGGDGRVSFLREKYKPKGGPDGGDGGKGGDVILMADENYHTLRDFRSKPNLEAQNGEAGKANNMFGKAGEDLTIKIPVGTLVYELRNGEEVLVGDFNKHNQTMIVAKGGVGGKGNFRFRSSMNQTPTQFTYGGPAVIKELKLEIKLVADVGIIGLPNAGKSTLINQLTKAAAKIGNYPFTTLEPNLGVAIVNNQRIAFADIPGLIEGASEGKGLGDEFLRHVERNRILLHLIDPVFDANTSGLIDFSHEENILHNVWENYQIIRNELKNFKSRFVDLTSKKEIVVINKIDVTEIRENQDKIKEFFSHKGIEVYFISAFTGEGVQEVLKVLSKELEKVEEIVFERKKPVKIIHIEDLKNRRFVYNISDNDEVKERTLIW